MRHFSGDAYPDLRRNMIAQFLAPFRGISSISSQHLAPAVAGDVTVRSHWKAAVVDGSPDYSRIVIVDLDITDLREAEKALEEAIESKERIMATLSHELRNPLSGVVGFSTILTEEWDSMDDETRHGMAKDIAAQVGDMSSLLDDFLAFNVDRSLCVEDELLTLAMVLEGLDLAGIGLEVDASLTVRGDALRIRQVIRNLVRNADKHGGGSRTLRTEARHGMVAIQMRDDGAGVTGGVGAPVRAFLPRIEVGLTGSGPGGVAETGPGDGWGSRIPTRGRRDHFRAGAPLGTGTCPRLTRGAQAGITSTGIPLSTALPETGSMSPVDSRLTLAPGRSEATESSEPSRS